MRVLPVLIFVLAFAPQVRAETSVTVAQLERFLTSSRATRMPDEEIADRLSKVTLSEQLTSKILIRIRAETALGQHGEEQLDLLAASSIFEAPPADELPKSAAPDAGERKRIVGLARDYARLAVSLLPDFIAVRSTRYFTNTPEESSSRRAEHRIRMHLARESRREIAFQGGHEIKRKLGSPAKVIEDENTPGGLSTWGEFGAILKVVLGDSSDDSLQWSRWQTDEAGTQLAVFRYTIPRADSHYAIDFCCFQKSIDEPADYEFHDKPGYSGEIYVDPKSGEVDRITLDAQLKEDDPVTRSAIAVQYGPVVIGGRRYICPLWSIAISDFHNALIEKIDGIGTERHLNETEFSEYHKFGSTSRIVNSAADGQNN